VDITKQKLLIETLFSSPETFAICYPIIKAEYFHADLQDAVRYIQKHYDDFSALPSPQIIEAETGHKLTQKEVKPDEIEYSVRETERFCRRKAVELAIRATPDLYQDEKFDEIEKIIKDAVLVSLHRDMGINFFEDPAERIARYLDDDPVEPIGWGKFDDMLDGGIARKQMLLFSANSGGGKSLALLNVGINFTLKGYTVLVITLELSAEMVDGRAIQMIASMDSLTWKKEAEFAAEKINKVGNKLTIKKDGEERSGSLHIRRMKNGTTANNIRAFLKEFELQQGKVPDMIVVDYVDLMGANENISRDNIFEKDKGATEELREIGEDYNAWIVTASQQNRGAVTAGDLNHSHIAGGISKINTTDVYVSIIMNDSMRAQGDMNMQFLKTRTSGGVGETVKVQFNTKTLRISKPDSLDVSMVNTVKKKPEKVEEDAGVIIETDNSSDLMDLMRSQSLTQPS